MTTTMIALLDAYNPAEPLTLTLFEYRKNAKAIPEVRLT